MQPTDDEPISQGLSAPLFGAACENATLFLVYNKCQDLIVATNPFGSTEHGLSEKAKGKRRELSTPELALAAAGAGSVASFVLYVCFLSGNLGKWSYADLGRREEHR